MTQTKATPIRTVQLLTKQQALDALEDRMQRAGVAQQAAHDTARAFLGDLERGLTLRFADLGQLSLRRGKVVVSPPQPLSVPAGSPWQSAASVGSAPLYTVAAEASIRRLMRGGYARRDAEVALSSAHSAP